MIADSTGADPARVQREHLHPLRFGNRCNAPVQKKTESLKIDQFTVARFNEATTQSSSKFDKL